MKIYNPPFGLRNLTLWGICLFIHFSIQAQIKETPKERTAIFMKWLEDDKKIPFEGDCFEGEGIDISKIDDKCIEKYFQNIHKTGLFSSIYIKNFRQEIQEKKAEIKKNGYAAGIEFDRYTLSQDPPSSKELLFALKNNSTSSIKNKTAEVAVKLRKPYQVIYVYTFDLENNIWKLSTIGTKQ